MVYFQMYFGVLPGNYGLWVSANFLKSYQFSVIGICHIPSIENCVAGSFSRNFQETFEWKLNGDLFQKNTFTIKTTTVNYFAS